MPLDPVKFGLSTENRIVVGEHLTRKNAQLFKLAQSHRKNNKIAQTFTENGIVKVRFAKGKNEKTFTIRSSIELETLIAQYELAMAHTHNANEASLSNTTTHTSTTPATAHTDIVPVTADNFIQLQQQQLQLQQQHQLNENAAAAAAAAATLQRAQPHQFQSHTPMQTNNN